MTLTLTGRNINYKHYQKENGEWVLKVYDYLNKVAFKVVEGNIYEALGEPLKITLNKYEIIPWNTETIPEQENPNTYKSILHKRNRITNICERK